VPAIHWFLIEFDGGVLVNAGVPEVSILRAQCREDVDGIILQVQGGVHDPANALVTITDTDAGTNFGSIAALPDAVNATFGLYDFDLSNNLTFTVCPTSVTASIPGAVDAVSAVDVRAAAPAPVALAAFEGPVSAIIDNGDGSGIIVVMGVTITIPATAPINSPTASLTVAQLADPTPLPGRSSPGFIGATAIINAQSDGVTTTADDVFVEPAENVIIGLITSASCTNADCSNPGDSLAVLNSPLVRLTDARIPAGPPANAFGFTVDLSQGALLGAVVSAEGYFGQIPTVPPPGGTTRFADVPATHPFFTQIEAIAAAGITGGCTAITFCPDNPVTRGEMAVFIETSLGGVPAACAGTFADVTAANPFCGFIELLAAGGITGGCGAGNFCPNDPITRGQMAVFIETALGNPANACTGQFTDVTTANPFCGFIERLAQDGITGGCGGTNFCPNDPVSRGQMAVFIVAAPSPLLP
jgi:hypothetical protein